MAENIDVIMVGAEALRSAIALLDWANSSPLIPNTTKIPVSLEWVGLKLEVVKMGGFRSGEYWLKVTPDGN